MYIVPIAWLYVVVMMSIAEATNTNVSLLGALITFVLYGVVPVALDSVFHGGTGRKRAIRPETRQNCRQLAHRTRCASCRPRILSRRWKRTVTGCSRHTTCPPRHCQIPGYPRAASFWRASPQICQILLLV
jgi:hypothetical protein